MSRPAGLPANGDWENYDFDRMLGSGQFGEVWLAFHRVSRLRVAVKILKPALLTHPEYRHRPADLLSSRVRSPHVVGFHYAFRDDNGWAIIMEYLAGASLSQRLKAGKPLTVGETLAVAAGVADGLRAAHLRGIIHRDLKPANIMTGEAGTLSGDDVKLVDFGLALGVPDRLDHDWYGSTTMQRAPSDVIDVAGTPNYMAPEQWYGSVTSASDLWALGAIMWECRTTRRLFGSQGACRQATIDAALDHGAYLGALRGDPPDLLKVIDRCLSVDPQARFGGSAEALLCELERIQRGKSSELAAARPKISPPPDRGVPRIEQVAAVQSLLEQSELVSIAGARGSGKTWIARMIASRRSPDAAWVSLRDVEDAQAMRLALMQALSGARPLEGEAVGFAAMTELVEHRLSEAKNLLIVFDDADDVLFDVSNLATAIASERVRVLVTSSNRPSGVGWESHVVPSLRLPPMHTTLSLDRARSFEAVAFFEACGHEALAGFRLEARDLDDVASLCVELGGSPGAIASAANKLWRLQVADLRRELADRSHSFGETRLARGLPARIRADIEKLPPETRTALERLSILEAPWTILSAEAVCCDATFDRESLHDALDALIKAHFVEHVARPGRPRYRVLSVEKGICRALLHSPERADELAAICGRHFEYFRQLAEDIDASSADVSGRPRECAQFPDDAPDCEAALRWALDAPVPTGDPLRLTVELTEHWFAHAEYDTGLRLIDRYIALVERRQPLRDDDGVALVRLIAAKSKLLYHVDLRASHVLSLRAIRLQRAIAQAAPPKEAAIHRLRIARLLQRVGLSGRQLGRTRAARKALLRATDSAVTRLALALVDIADQRYDTAERRLNAIRQELAQDGDKVLLSSTICALGDIAWYRGDLDDAIDHCRESLELRVHQGDRQGVEESLRLAMGIATSRGLWRLAAMLRGATERRRMALRSMMMPAHAELYETNLAKLRANLSTSEAKNAARSGAVLSDDELLALISADETWRAQ